MAKFPRFTTGTGTAKFAHLNRPDTKFNPEGEYKVTMVFDLKDPKTQELVDFLEAGLKEICKAVKAKGKKPRADRAWEIDEDEGTLEVRFKQKCREWMNGKNPIMFYDAQRQPIADAPAIYGGSTLRVFFEAAGYDVTGKQGLSLRPKGIQVINLQGGASMSAESMGFDEEEGYEYQETKTAKVSHSEEDEDDFDSEDDEF